jgi:periplasmic protein CpxP/Spy
MRKGIFIVLLAAIVSIVSGAAIAQDNGAQQQAPPAGEHGYGHHHFDPQKRTEMLTKQLKLTSDQQAKVLDILKSEQSQMEGLRSDTSMSQDDRRSKMMDIRKTSNDQIRGLLDANQQKKWDEMQSQHEQWGHHPEGQGAPSGDSQPK